LINRFAAARDPEVFTIDPQTLAPRLRAVGFRCSRRLAVEHPDRGPATDGRHGQEAALPSTDQLHSACFGVNVIRRFEAFKLRIDIALEQA
jgi:hypothetical protein